MTIVQNLHYPNGITHTKVFRFLNLSMIRAKLLILCSNNNFILIDIVTITHHPGTARQMHTLTNCIRNNAKSNTWVALFDMDEYLVLRTTKNIHGFIDQVQPNLGGQISINWKFCGSNGHQNYSSELIVKRFTRCQFGLG